MKGIGCKLIEPVCGTQFDLNKLHSELGLKVDGQGEDFIDFNVCGKITKLCAGAKSAACFHRNGREHNFGKFKYKLYVQIFETILPIYFWSFSLLFWYKQVLSLMPNQFIWMVASISILLAMCATKKPKKVLHFW